MTCLLQNPPDFSVATGLHLSWTWVKANCLWSHPEDTDAATGLRPRGSEQRLVGSQGKEFRGLGRIRDTTSEKDEVILKGSDTLLSLMVEGRKGSKKLKTTAHQQQVKDSEENRQLSPHLTTTWTLLIKEIPLLTNKQEVSYQKKRVSCSIHSFYPCPHRVAHYYRDININRKRS